MKRAILLALMFALTNFSMTTQGYSQIDSIRTIAEGEIDAPPSSGGESAGNTPSTGDGSTSEGENDSDTTNPNEPIEPIRPGTSPEHVDKEVELDGAIGPWEPNSSDMPNFNGVADGDIIGTKPSDDKLFKISVTVPLNMDFMIVNRLENGGSFYGKFVSPYHSITNNGTYPLNVSLNSFTRVNESNNSASSARTDSSTKDTKLYIREPEAGNNKVEMRLSLNYDRPQQGTYLKTINLNSENTNRTSEENKLGEIGSNETARIYYRSDLWETPKSEGIETDVVSNFSLILSFSTQNANSGIGNGAGGSAGTGSEGNVSSTPSSGGSNEGADSGSGSTGSSENLALQNPSES